MSFMQRQFDRQRLLCIANYHVYLLKCQQPYKNCLNRRVFSLQKSLMIEVLFALFAECDTLSNVIQTDKTIVLYH